MKSVTEPVAETRIAWYQFVPWFWMQLNLDLIWLIRFSQIKFVVAYPKAIIYE